MSRVGKLLKKLPTPILDGSYYAITKFEFDFRRGYPCDLACIYHILFID
jgi:hypothetical protein